MRTFIMLRGASKAIMEPRDKLATRLLDAKPTLDSGTKDFRNSNRVKDRPEPIMALYAAGRRPRQKPERPYLEWT